MPNEPQDPRLPIDGKIIALLAYFPFLCIIPFLLRKEDTFVLAHAKHGLVIFVAEIGVFILSIIFPPVLKLGMFILLAVSFIGMLAVLTDRPFPIPLVSRLADRISL